MDFKEKLNSILDDLDLLTDYMADAIIEETGYSIGDSDEVFDSSKLAVPRDEIQQIHEKLSKIEENL